MPSLPVVLTAAGHRHDETIEDLSETGAFLCTSRSAPIGAFIRVRLQPRWPARPLELDAQVMWKRNRPGQSRGLGMRFVFRQSSQVAGVKKLVDSLSA